MSRDPNLLPVVRGENRHAKSILSHGYSNDPNVTGSTRRQPLGQSTLSSSRSFGSDEEQQYTEAHVAPREINRDYNDFYLEFPFVQAALTIFDEEVIEPGWHVEARDENGEVDKQMTEALRYWGKHCAIHGGKRGKDLRHIIEGLPSGRRVKPAQFLEITGTRDDPNAIAGLMPLDASSMEIWTHRNQNLIVHPEDRVGPKHPMVERGGKEFPAGYVQYAQISKAKKADEIRFTEDEVLKLTHKPPANSPWGRTIWPAIKDNIEGLKQKLSDRNAAIRLTGWPHRMYIGENWDPDFAQRLATMHKGGDVSAWDDEGGKQKKSYAGRNDFLPGKNGDVEVKVAHGEVPDISGAIKDDVEGIFSMLPVGKFKIAYEDDVNQFVVEPQNEKDNRYIDSERGYQRATFEPLFLRKSDELAGGSYAGEVDWVIKQEPADNPLERSDFDVEGVATLIGAFADYARADADAVFGKQLPFWIANMDPNELGESMDVLDAIVNGEGQQMDDAAEEIGMPEPGMAGDA